MNPDREGGSEIALPDDPELLADLTAPTFEVRTGGILIESKEEIRKRLGRITNKGDAVVMCLAPGNTAVKRQINARRRGDRPKFANVGYSARRSNGCGGREDDPMTADDTDPAEATPADERRRARQAELDAANAHGQQLVERYGRMDCRPRFAVLGHMDGKRRRRR